MNKLKMQTPNLTAQNIDKIAALFPNCITEMQDEEKSTPDHKVYKRGINFELLKQMLSPDVVDGDEAYEFTWVGKKASIVEANKPIRKTLRPCPEESKNWDDTENLYIEGDNLEVLKLLQESYLGKVKMIYIDPPYNTGHDFIYPDSFIMDMDEYNDGTGYFDEDGNVNYSRENILTAGRYHSDWCSMIYSRLLLARNLLSDNGVIFISIDDNSQDDLKKCCGEIFGESNFVSQLIWEKKFAPQNDDKYITAVHDYILVYAKDKTKWSPKLQERDSSALQKFKNPDNDPRGVWTSGDLTSKTKAAGHSYAITSPSGKEFYPPEGRQWAPAYETYLKLKSENRLWFGEKGDNVPRQKQFLTEIQNGVVPTSILFHSECGHNQEAKKELISLLPGIGNSFETPKPVRLLMKLLNLVQLSDNDIILDFFSGSATTAHAVMQLNAKDNSHRKFIMVQLPEPCDEKSEAYKAGYKTICDIGKERIRRAGTKIVSENNTINTPSPYIDVGFRVFKLDDTNMKDVYYSAEEYSQTNLEDLESNIKEDRTDLDLLFGCLLDWGLPLSMPYRSEKIGNCTVHTYAPGDAALNVPDALIACFDSNVPENVIKKIAKRKPRRAVFRDSSFASSPEKINVFEIFKLYAQDTDVKVI
ncbi:site-specific DNA-methyltransferase [Faecalibacterium prausnitzii]|uniref:site-specific DNA-methyltransferase n=1 Tax=Faecalibacterium prausnitzii TaxID=853 RepID=UPI0012DC0B48|nr:site-specific DNA-methyltransferase [Faecalibacterium prausnitzii]